MSHRAVRVTGTARVERFTYAGGDGSADVPLVVPPGRPRSAQVLPAGPGTHPRVGVSPMHVLSAPTAPDPRAAGDAETREREAFAAGYAQGERAGVDVAARQLQAVHERLGRTLDELLGLREELTYRTERQVVELALAMAARILHREVSLDRELLLVMARIALDRMGDATTATIRLHPDDEAAARGSRESWPGGSVAIVADPSVRPGACAVQTAQGQVEVGVDAQVKELATALLGEAPLVPQGASR